jgi:putative transposase
VAILKEGAAGRPTAELLRAHGMSAATYYAWKFKYGGMSVSELKRLKDLIDRKL